MAIIPMRLTAGICGEPVGTFTMSLTQGWDKTPPEQGGRALAAGDLVVLIVRRPFPVAAGPSGWTQATSNAFYKLIGPPESEQPPTFSAAGAADWEIDGYAVASTDLRPLDGSGSAVPWATIAPAGPEGDIT